MDRMTDDYCTGRPLQDWTALEYILLGDLRDLLEEPPDEHTLKWMLAVLDALLAAIPQELQLREEGGGYLSEVLEQYPSWFNHVERLRDEKESLFRKLRMLRSEIEDPESFPLVVDDARATLRDWMTSFVAHHRHERRLIQTAYTLEVGVGD